MSAIRRILIDAASQDERIVVVEKNGHLSDFDYETITKKQIKGNVYLGKVTRVEPSLQAAFVDYGDEKQGFLPFSDIHPDYYQIPADDRDKLINAKNSELSKIADSQNDDDDSADIEDDGSDENEIGSKFNLYRKYQIQEVVKKGQVILVQVMKEERGNKGVSLTTYISLAGKYCVLMPNSPGKGGVSKKIESAAARRDLKAIINQLNNDHSRSLIIRTAGTGKDFNEIGRDYNYLVSLWNNIRNNTLKASAPAFIHAEDDIIKRTVRDFYDENTTELIINERESFDAACNFADLLIPNRANNISLYDDKIPMFSKYKIDQQIESLYSHKAQLKSGGYLVINVTEALIVVDVNSGKATKERGIEETALKTNLEAAEEVARQLRLRDLSGLIVIDFIDMNSGANRRAVERAMRSQMNGGRARVQVGRISPFGLLEMSRQRTGSSFFEGRSDLCPLCDGYGIVKSVSAIATDLIRTLEYECIRGMTEAITVHGSAELVTYLLNYKKTLLTKLEQRYKIKIIATVAKDVTAQGFYIRKRKALTEQERRLIDVSSDIDSEELAAHSEPKQQRKNENHKKRSNNRQKNKPIISTAPKEESLINKLLNKIKIK